MFTSVNGTTYACDGDRGAQGPAGVPCTNCVGRNSINGAEIPIYGSPTNGVCGPGGALTLDGQGTCQSVTCGGSCSLAAFIPWYFDCAGNCNRCGSPATCNVQLRGYMMSPSIGN